MTAALGRRAAFIGCRFPGCDCYMDTIRDALREAGVTIVGETEGAAPNAPAKTWRASPISCAAPTRM